MDKDAGDLKMNSLGRVFSYLGMFIVAWWRDFLGSISCFSVNQEESLRSVGTFGGLCVGGC